MKAMPGWALGASLAAASLVACGGDDDSPANNDAGKSDVATDTRADMSTTNDGRTDTNTTDNRDTGTADNRDGTGEGGPEGGNPDGGDGGTVVQRGEYLVKSLGGCGDCHTPRNFITGQPDNLRFLAGMSGIFQVPGLGPDGGPGVIGASNLTPDMATGLGAWTDAQIKNAMLNGIGKDGKSLFPIMPYYVLHNMSDADADAIVAYLRTIPAISNAIQPRNFEAPPAAPPVPADRIPNPTLPSTDPNYASAMRGKYLAGNFGVCMECHTKHVQTPGAVPLELDKLFAGGETFISAAIGLPPNFPPTITTENITPHATGVQGWTAQAIATVLKTGINKDGLPICPPMPNGPEGAFGGLTDDDARDIGNYIIHLPPIDNLIPLICHNVMNKDGGTDGGRDGATDGATGDAVSDTATPDATPDTAPDAPADNASPDTARDTGGASDGSDGSTDGSNDGATDGATDGAGGDATGDGSNDAAG
jgi:mono/diheme cytochrome c family protein